MPTAAVARNVENVEQDMMDSDAGFDEALASFELLREASEPAHDRVKKRLAQVRDLFAEDIAEVDRELSRLVRDGVSPATESAAHLLDAGGKRVRPMTVILSAACFGTPPPMARHIALVAELVHLATLLHDDVIDDGQERRGNVTSRRVWGNAVSVLAGDLLLTHALQRTASSAPQSVLTDLFVTLRRLVDGEVMQLRGRSKLDLSEEVYFRIVRGKTASLFEWAARSGAACAGAPQDSQDALGHFGAHVGLAFQLVDDVLDYSGEPRTAGKALLSDLTEGKVTLPLIRAFTAGATLSDDLDAVRAGDDMAATRVAEAVRSSGACDGVRALARDETEQAVRALDSLPPTPARALLAAIATELAQRVA